MKTKLMAFIFAAAFSSVGFAAEETSAIASPNCDAEKLKEIGGDGIMSVEKGALEGGYNVTIDTDITNSGDLIGKMAAAGCM